MLFFYSIVPTAFLATSVIFTSFTLVALWTEKRAMLYLGGSLLAGLNLLLIAGFINIFLGSYIVLQVDVLYNNIMYCINIVPSVPAVLWPVGILCVCNV